MSAVVNGLLRERSLNCEGCICTHRWCKVPPADSCGGALQQQSCTGSVLPAFAGRSIPQQCLLAGSALRPAQHSPGSCTAHCRQRLTGVESKPIPSKAALMPGQVCSLAAAALPPAVPDPLPSPELPDAAMPAAAWLPAAPRAAASAPELLLAWPGAAPPLLVCSLLLCAADTAAALAR